MILQAASLIALSLSSVCSQELKEPLSFEVLQARVQQCAYGSVEEVLSILPEAFRARYVLMHHSQSSQGATYSAPRAILYAEDASFVLSFNGDASENHFDHLEMLQYRSETERFEARDISFANKQAQISSANPRMCQRCHETDLRPNWETYPLWPGAYGGEDDLLYRNEANSEEGEEAKQFQNFVQHFQNQGRYCFLAQKPSAKLPNTDLGSKLQSLNLLRVARKVRDVNVLNPYRYALVASAACFYADSVSNVTEFIPSKTIATFKNDLRTIKIETAKLNREEFLARGKTLQSFDTSAPHSERVSTLSEYAENADADTDGNVSDQRVAALRWIVENLGQSTADWGLQHQPQSYDFENGYTGIAELTPILAQALFRDPNDASLATRLSVAQIPQAGLNSICQELKTKSLASISSYPLSK